MEVCSCGNAKTPMFVLELLGKAEALRRVSFKGCSYSATNKGAKIHKETTPT